MARGYGGFSIWYSNKKLQSKQSRQVIDAMSDKEFYGSYNHIRHLITNKSILKRLDYLDAIYK